MGNYSNASTLMGYYFGQGSPTDIILKIMRDGFEKGVWRNIDDALIGKSASEVQRKRRNLDKGTYPFAYDLSKELYGKRTIALMLIEGTFVGSERSIDSVIAADLGRNPHSFFIKGRYIGETVDTHVTREQAMDYLWQIKEQLHEQGFTHYVVKRSRVFYLRNEDAKRFEDNNGRLDLEQLVPFLIPTQYVGLMSVKKPTLEEYKQKAPIFVSYRLKQSVREKLLKRLMEKDPAPIKDWVAYRIVVDSEEEAGNLFRTLKGTSRIGNHQIEIIDEDDSYPQPKPSGFRAKELVVRVLGGREEPYITEIQIVDREQYYKNEFVGGASSHKDLEKRRKHLPRNKKNVAAYYGGILEEIFGAERLPIDIPEVEK